MIQFNLLPDVKLEYVKAQRTKHVAISISIIVAAAALGIMLILLLVVDVWQKKSLDDINQNIAKYSNQIENTPDLNKILTVQNQLQALPALDSQKPAVSQLFKYISQLTPNNVDISQLTLGLSADTWNVSGTANNLATVDKFVDTFKFTTYSTGGNSNSHNAFSNVVLSSFGVSSQGTSYDIALTYAPAIFESSQNVNLTVPNIISTRSETQQPSNLFILPSNGQNNNSSQ